MSYTPNKQYTQDEDVSGQELQGGTPLMFDADTGTMVPLTLGTDRNFPKPDGDGSGVLGWMTSIYAAIKLLTASLSGGIQVFPSHAGTLGDPFSVAVEEGYDTDNPVQYPLVLKAGTSQKQLMVSVEQSQLPTGAATSSAQVTAQTSLGNIDTGIGTDGAAPPVIAGTGVRGFLRAIYDHLVSGIGVTGTFWQVTQPVSGTFWQATQPVSATSLPLPALAATSTKQSDGTQKTQVVDGSGNVQPAGDTSGRAIKVDASATTQPISAVSLPLPALAATSTKQSDGTQKTQVVDGLGNVQPAGDTSGRAIKVDASATTQPVSAVSLPLPAGAATSAAQTTAQTSLGNIDTGIGTDGATPPTIPGTGVRGWLRACYDTFQLIKAIFPTVLDVNSGNKSASTLRFVLATDQPQLTNKLLVTPDSVALPAHQSVNVDQLAGTTPDTNSGSKSAGTIRVVLATDQPALTNKLLVTPDSVSVPITKTALTASGPTTTTVGTSTASAVASNANRKGLILVNTSANTISLGLGASAVLNSGITLGPGDSWCMDEYSFFTGTVNAIASAGSSNLAIQEFTT